AVFSPAQLRTKMYDPTSTLSSPKPHPPYHAPSTIPSIGQPTDCVFVVPSGLVIVREHGSLNSWGMTDEFLGDTPTQNRIDSPSTYLGFSRRRTGWIPATAPGALVWARGADIGALPM